MESARNIIEFR